MGMEKITVAERRLLARQIGNELVKTHGKKKHYTVPEVKAAARRQKTPEYWDCWALCLYTSPVDFADHHAATGQSCDYNAMHGKMVEAVSTDAALPDAVHHFSPATESSWFSDLLDSFSLDGLDIDP